MRLSCAIALVLVSLSAEAAFAQPARPYAGSTCALRTRVPRWPHSVVIFPEPMKSPVWAPFAEAVCDCFPPGKSTRVHLRILPDEGRVMLESAPRIVPDEGRVMLESARKCMSTHTMQFTPFELLSDCIDCGPKSIRPRRASPTRTPAPPPYREPSVIFILSVVLDRTSDALRPANH